MRAMVLTTPRSPLQQSDISLPAPGPGHIQVRIAACGVCRTDLHVCDGELPDPKQPIVPGHEIVGVVSATGEGVDRFHIGQRVGIPWLGYTCGVCQFCQSGRENLCIRARFTGYQIDGGYADFTIADQGYAFSLPESYSDTEAAPLMCAGLIGYRSLVMAGDGQRLGLYGFGAAAHIIIQVALHQGRKIYAFSRPGDTAAQQFARSLGAYWAGDSTTMPPDELDAAIIFAPVGSLVPLALQAVGRGGAVVCAGIHMSDIPSFPYRLLWEERTVRSVANLTRKDAEEFLALAPQVPVRTEVQPFPLDQANEALTRLRSGQIHGAAVLVMQ